MERNMVSLFLTKGDRVLLLYREGGRVVNHLYVAACGGHMEKDELNNAKAAVIREMQEELGITERNVGEIRLRYITLRNTGAEIRQNYYFFAELPDAISLSSNEGRLQWCTEAETLSLPMPQSAKAVIAHYFREGKGNDTLYGCISDGPQSHIMPMRA